MTWNDWSGTELCVGDTDIEIKTEPDTWAWTSMGVLRLYYIDYYKLRQASSHNSLYLGFKFLDRWSTRNNY